MRGDTWWFSMLFLEGVLFPRPCQISRWGWWLLSWAIRNGTLGGPYDCIGCIALVSVDGGYWRWTKHDKTHCHLPSRPFWALTSGYVLWKETMKVIFIECSRARESLVNKDFDDYPKGRGLVMMSQCHRPPHSHMSGYPTFHMFHSQVKGIHGIHQNVQTQKKFLAAIHRSFQFL